MSSRARFRFPDVLPYGRRSAAREMLVEEAGKMPRRKSISPALPSSATVAAIAAVCAFAVTGGPLEAPPSRDAPPGASPAGLTSASVVATSASPVVDFGFPTAGMKGPRPVL